MMREKIITLAAVAAFFSSNLFFFGPWNLYFTNVLEFNYCFADIAYLLIGICCISTLAVVSVGCIFINSAVFKKIAALLLAVSFLLWLQGNLLVSRYGVFDGAKIDWSRHTLKGLLECGLWLEFLILGLRHYAFVYRHAARVSLFFILVQSVCAPVTMANAPRTESKNYVIDGSRAFVFSRHKNVVVLLLDTFQSDVFQEVIDSDPSYKSMFSGFIYFRNAVSGFPTSMPAVPVLLTGVYYDNAVPKQKFIKDSFLSAGSLPRILKSRGFRVELYPDMNSSVYLSERTVSNAVKKMASSDITAKDLRRLLAPVFFRYSPHFIKMLIYDPYESLLAPQGTAEQRDSWVAPSSAQEDLALVRKAEAWSVTAGQQGVFKFFHLWGMHKPWTINERLEPVKLQCDRESGLVNAKGVLQIVDKFMRTLKKIGAYDNSMILVVADHGYGRAVYVPADMAREYQGKLFMEDYQKASGLPLVLVKPFDARGELVVSDAPVCLADIPKSVCASLGFWTGFAGVSIFDDIDALRSRRYLYYEWGHKFWDTDYLPPMREFTVRGHSWLVDAWQETPRRTYMPGWGYRAQ